MTQAPADDHRRNRRGDATRRTIIDAALEILAEGSPATFSVNGVAKRAGATWGAVKYQFGDADGLWKAVLDRMEERRGALHLAMEPGASLRERVAHVIDALWAGLNTRDAQAFEGLRASLPHDRGELETLYPQTAAALASWHDGWQRACADAFAGLDLDPDRVAEVAAYLPGAMRGLNSERNLSTYSDMDDARRGLIAAVTAHLGS